MHPVIVDVVRTSSERKYGEKHQTAAKRKQTTSCCKYQTHLAEQIAAGPIFGHALWVLLALNQLVLLIIRAPIRVSPGQLGLPLFSSPHIARPPLCPNTSPYGRIAHRRCRIIPTLFRLHLSRVLGDPRR